MFLTSFSADPFVEQVKTTQLILAVLQNILLLQHYLFFPSKLMSYKILLLKNVCKLQPEKINIMCQSLGPMSKRNWDVAKIQARQLGELFIYFHVELPTFSFEFWSF